MTDVEKADRLERLTAALLLAFVEAHGAAPVTQLAPVAEALDRWGVQQTDAVDREAIAEAMAGIPGWLKEKVREESQPTPVEPDHHAVQETSRVATAPKRPSRIAKKNLGVVKGG